MSIDLSQIRTFDSILGTEDGTGNGMRDYILSLTLTADGFDGRTVDSTDLEFLTQAILAPTANEIANLNFIFDFLTRAVGVNALLEVDQDPVYKANLASALFRTDEQTQDLIDLIFNRHGDNLNVPRKESTQATGVQTFSRTTAPPGDILIPAGTRVSTTATSIVPAVAYTTVNDVTMVAATATPSPTTGLYEVEVPIIAVQDGDSGNQAAGAINIIVSGITGISATTNKNKAQGGEEAEANDVYVDRINAAIPGAELSTETGIFNVAFSVQNVSDVAVIGTGNPLMVRDGGNGGKVDVYLLSNLNEIQPVTDEVHAYSGAQNDYVMDNQPVEPNLTLHPITVKAYLAGVFQGTLASPADYSFVKDRSVNYQWSSLASDKITLTPAGHTTITGFGGADELRISYTYDRLIAEVQAIYDDPDGHDITMDIQVRKSKSATLNIALSAELLPGFTLVDVQNGIATVVDELFSIGSRILGQKGLQSVITEVIQASAEDIGIVQVIEPMVFALADGNDSLAQTSAVIDGNGNASINAAEFLQIGTITVSSI